MARDRADEARLARIVAEGAAERPDGLAQRAVGDDDVRPDAIEDVAAVHGLVTQLDQQDEQVEIARDERHLAAFAQEEPAPGREREITEAVSNHDGDSAIIVGSRHLEAGDPARRDERAASIWKRTSWR